ncbi:hypothetical protein FPOAC2_04358 [Fusarium poae]|uniref:hypothetical protein n=1 Tax=Fusarium poae TaxID=36050 RepID=UPI001CEA362B|nr:hypothetical protein FPOAC1_004279 [Fusarium poae]KAG8671042.1 hypothetical protein FPOAC1_004279 [Fusarium poae]
MPTTYTITIQNNSGSNQNYALFNEVPKLESSVSAKVWNNALRTARAGPNSSTTFNITSQFFAYIGSSSGVPGQDDVTVDVSSSNEVELGSTDLEGNPKKGTTLKMDVVDMAPQFTGKVAAGGKVGAFSIQTAAGNEDNQFTFNNARDNGWVIGLGKVINGKTVPAATIIPQPNCSYQIQPVNKWYIAYGTYRAGQVCNFEMSSLDKATVDFANSSNARVIHSPSGQLTTQAQ